MPTARIHRQKTYPPAPHLGFGLLLILIQLVAIGLTWVQLPPQIPLFYSLPYGFGQLASMYWIFLIPSLSLASWLIVFFLTKLKVQTTIYHHVQFWMLQLILFLFTISLIHIVLVIL